MVLTTSWDDGHPKDQRLAEVLLRYNLKGTFYVPAEPFGHPLMSTKELRALLSLGMEVGAHTVTHARLTDLRAEEVWREVEGGKTILEERLGTGVRCFCYPWGKWNRRVRDIVRQVGFSVARTTASFCTELDENTDFLSLPTTVQFCYHPRLIHIRHALVGRNFSGLLRWAWQCRCTSEISGIIGGLRPCKVLHLWGHSWEIDRFHQWKNLEELLARITGEFEVCALTNGEVYDRYGRGTVARGRMS